MANKKVVLTNIESVSEVDKKSGEIVNQTIKHTNKISSVESEPPYIKLYIQDISQLNGLTSNQSSILHEILRLVQYETNEVILNKYNRNKIVSALQTTDATIRNCIVALTKRKILYKIATGVYRINPYLFGTGSWQNIKGLRLTIDYTEEGRKQQLEEVME